MLIDLGIYLPIPVGFGIGPELAITIHRWGAVLRPQAVCAAKRWNATLYRHAGASHYDDILGFGDYFGGTVKVCHNLRPTRRIWIKFIPRWYGMNAGFRRLLKAAATP